jgi:hypothetical protein
MAQIGRASVFREKEGGRRYQGIVTKVGAQCFERKRAELAMICGRPVKRISDADVFEFMARGEANTRAYLAKHALDRDK